MHLPDGPPSAETLHTAAAILAGAFQHDPHASFVFPDPATRQKRLPAMFAAMIAADSPVGACLVTPGGEAASLWRAPGFPHDSLWATIVGLPKWVAAIGPGIGRALAFSLASDANHPPEPHWYLHLVGCQAALQGRGHGRAAIQPGLDRADADGVATYLETATPQNIGYYASMGFVVSHGWRPRGGPDSWSLLRRPR